MNSKILINGLTTDKVEIIVLNRTHPEATDKWDGNWLNAYAEITAGRFNGKGDIFLRCDELQQFAKDIDLLIQVEINDAVFSPMEPWLCLSIKSDNSSKYRISGEITDRLGTGNILKFFFELDRGCTEKVAEGIKETINVFPIRPN